MPSFTFQVTTKDPTCMFPSSSRLRSGFFCAQRNHCKSGMVFAINPATTGDKTFDKYMANAMGGAASTVTAATTTAVTTSVTASPAPVMSQVPGVNVGTDGQCQCVCNIDVGNGAANPSIQGMGVFGGSLGNVQGTSSCHESC